MTTRNAPRERGAADIRIVGLALLAVLLGVVLGLVVLADDDSARNPDDPSPPTTDATGDNRTAEALVDEGLQLHVEGDLAGAAARYRAATALDPGNKLAHYNLGLIHQLRGRPEEAMVEYRITLELDGRYAPALYNLGVVLAADGDTDGAMALYTRAIEVDDTLADAHFNLGLLLLADGDEVRGNEAIERALELDPQLAERLREDG